MATKPNPVSAAPGSSEEVKPLDAMTLAELERWDREFIAAIEAGDDSAALANLAAGFPIYYAEEDTPENCVIKEYPNRRKELVSRVDGKEKTLYTI